jgi:hypothetical protein
MKIKFGSFIVWFLLLVGVASLITLLGTMLIFMIYKSDEEDVIKITLEKNWGTKRYFTEINQEPLEKSDIVQVVRAIVLEENPSSALLEILYDLKDGGVPDDATITVGILKDSGWPETYYARSAGGISAKGGKATVEIGLSDTSKEEIVATNMILIRFATSAGVLHEARYEYERVWCKASSDIKSLLSQRYPGESQSQFSTKSSRTISRICLPDNINANKALHRTMIFPR